MSLPVAPAPMPAEPSDARAPRAPASPVTPARRGVVELLHTADVLRRRFLLALAPYRVSLPQYNVLRILRGAGGGPLASTMIADRMIEQALGVTSLLERMDAMGWIRRDHAAPPGLLAYALAPAGERLLAQVDPVLDAECAAVMAPLPAAQWPELAVLLRVLREG